MIDARPIGLTGSIAGGKSTVLKMLADMGLRTASSDVIAREVFREAEVQSALAKRLGVEGEVISASLRESMLRDPELRRWTNRLMHPLVGTRAAKVEVDVVEVPLLFEACLQGHYREVWTVSCGEAERRRRLLERYGADIDPVAYQKWQLSERVKETLADRIVRTDLPYERVLAVVETEAARCFPERIAHPE